MVIAVWPPTLPQEFDKEGYSRDVPDLTIRSSMDIGPAKVRYRGGNAPDTVSITLILDDTQRDTLVTFATKTVKGGALPFEFPDPENPKRYIMARFAPSGNSSLFSISQYQNSILWQVSIKLEIWKDLILG